MTLNSLIFMLLNLVSSHAVSRLICMLIHVNGKSNFLKTVKKINCV